MMVFMRLWLCDKGVDRQDLAVIHWLFNELAWFEIRTIFNLVVLLLLLPKDIADNSGPDE